MTQTIKITDERVEALRVQYGLDPSDFWELPQRKGTWIAKHSALEVIAVKAGIQFDPPQIIEADTQNGIAVLAVRGSLSTVTGIQNAWATGEASPGNNRNAYPWAMAEKRAKDRVVLKLAGIHGLVYSEDEMEQKPPPAPDGQWKGIRQDSDYAKYGPSGKPPADIAEEAEPMSNTAAKAHWKLIADEMFAATTIKQLQGVWERHYRVYQQLPDSLQNELAIWKDELKGKLLDAAPKPFPGDEPQPKATRIAGTP